MRVHLFRCVDTIPIVKVTLTSHILAGRYPYNTGMNDYNHGVEEERSSVPVSFAMLPKLLKNAPTPYMTHMLGKCTALSHRHLVNLMALMVGGTPTPTLGSSRSR